MRKIKSKGLRRYLSCGLAVMLLFSVVGCKREEQNNGGGLLIGEEVSKVNLNNYEEISISNKENIDRGDLILVNNKTLYDKDTYEENKKNLKSMDKLKSDSYTMYYKGLTLNEDAILALNEMSDAAKEEAGIKNYVISSAFRTATTQQQFLEREIKEVGEELGRRYVAQPYGSEHQTGLAIDYRLLQPNGEMIRLKENHSEFEWLRDNCYKYGYILRYLEEKKDITEIEYEPWHYRYVGMPHSYIMTDREMVLEEYIDYLKRFKFGEKHLEETIDGVDYEIYYIEMSEGETTKINVPKDKEYTLSGNNVDGYIITFKK